MPEEHALMLFFPSWSVLQIQMEPLVTISIANRRTAKRPPHRQARNPDVGLLEWYSRFKPHSLPARFSLVFACSTLSVTHRGTLIALP